MRKSWILGSALLLGLAACGDTTGEQALIGGGAGAIIGEATGNDPVVGGIAGAAGNVAYCEAYPRRC